MALIHQTLYQSGNLADIDMADYIRSLSGNLLSSQARVAMPPTVNFDLSPLHLAIDKAIPLALIINELVTNGLKHAFPDGRPGEIRISLQERRGTARRAPNEETDGQYEKGTARRAPTIWPPTYELTVADDGVGLPAGFDAKNQKSLGLQLVTMLTKQLDGSLAIESKGGTIRPHHFQTMKKTKNNPESDALRVLILEDNPADAELIERELKRAGIVFTSLLVEGKREFKKALAEFRPQVILSDFKLPRFDGLAALEIARHEAPDTPFIFVSGSIGEEKAIETLTLGASDYIFKDNLQRLGPAVKRAIEEARLKLEKKKTERGITPPCRGTAAPGRGGRALRADQ